MHAVHVGLTLTLKEVCLFNDRLLGALLVLPLMPVDYNICNMHIHTYVLPLIMGGG